MLLCWLFVWTPLLVFLYKTAAAFTQAGGECTRGSRNEGPFANRAGLIITGMFDCLGYPSNSSDSSWHTPGSPFKL